MPKKFDKYSAIRILTQPANVTVIGAAMVLEEGTGAEALMWSRAISQLFAIVDIEAAVVRQGVNFVNPVTGDMWMVRLAHPLKTIWVDARPVNSQHYANIAKMRWCSPIDLVLAALALL